MTKKINRPKLPPGEGKRFPLNTRTTKVLRDWMDAASKASGRSLSQEVEYRLERSFMEQDFAEQIRRIIHDELQSSDWTKIWWDSSPEKKIVG